MSKHPLSAFDEGGSHVTPEHRLAMAIIINAIGEAMGVSSINETKAARTRCQDAALRWFKDAGSDFQAICDLADLNPECVRKAALAYIDTGVRLPKRSRRGVDRRNVDPTGLTVTRIAQRAGVSASSVRNVLNGTGSPEMKARVQAAIKAMEQPANDR